MSLPTEILAFELVKHLDTETKGSLWCALDAEVAEETYNETFHDNTKFANYTASLFYHRSRARLWTFGDSREDHRSPYQSPNFEQVCAPDGSGPFKRTCRPVRVDATDSVVAKVAVGHSEMFVLTEKGDIYLTGTHVTEKRAKMHRHSKLGCNLCTRNNSGCPLVDVQSVSGGVRMSGSQPGDVQWHKYEEDWTKRYASYCAHPGERHTFVDISCDGRLYGLDTEGNVRRWYSPWDGHDWFNEDMCNEYCLPLYVERFSGHTYDPSNVIGQRGLSVRRDGVLFKGRGIALTYGDDGNEESPISMTVSLVVPGTACVREWGVLNEFAVYLDTEGRVRLVVFPAMYNIDNDINAHFDPAMINSCDSVNRYGPFVVLSVSSTQFALVSETGRVVVVIPKYDNVTNEVTFDLEVVSNLPSIASVSISDTHLLALSQNGDVFSWGRERDLNGCLGLGSVEEAVNSGARFEHVLEEREDFSESDDEDEKVDHVYLVLDTPVKIRLPGRAYGVFAGYNSSAVLIEGE